MTPEQVAAAIRGCHGTADDTSIDAGALLALAGIATEYLAAIDAWNASAYTDAELLGAAARLECAELELRTALGLPGPDAPIDALTELEPPNPQTTFEFPTCVESPDSRTTR